ncbi:MAG: DUF3050 domain-containing protein [Bacteroidota bacterium]
MDRIEIVENSIQDLRKILTNHSLYKVLSDVDDIRLFMEWHVYAVWDFMSLLKALQNHLTCTSLPWKPKSNAATARFINEIVFGEESDVNEQGIPTSHFDMYLDAMKEVNADTTAVVRFMNASNSVDELLSNLDRSDLETEVLAFLRFTFETIATGEPHKIAAAFTFGREDLIPDMFIQIIEQSGKEAKNRFPKLLYYLQRHIEVDGDEHGPLSLEMVKELCGDDQQKWEEAQATAQLALSKRINLWNGITRAIERKQRTSARSLREAPLTV